MANKRKRKKNRRNTVRNNSRRKNNRNLNSPKETPQKDNSVSNNRKNFEQRKTSSTSVRNTSDNRARQRRKSSSTQSNDVINFTNTGINRFVNKLVIDDEKKAKKEARRRSLSKYNIFAKPEPRRRTKTSSNSDYDFLGGNKDIYGDEYYDKAAMRRIQRKKRRKKPLTIKMLRRRKVITCGLLVVAIAAACIVLSLTVLFRTEGYTVSGSTRYDDQEIIDACGISIGENIFIANKKAAEQRLINAFPYISDVDVRASFPDKIKIKITEGKQSYQVKYSGNEYSVVSAEGRILKINNGKIKNLPVVKGLSLKSTTVGSYVEYSDKNAAAALEMIVTSVSKHNFNGLTEINIKNKANINVVYDGRITIRIGVPEQVDYKIRTAMAIINEKLDPNNTGAIAGDLDVSACNTTKRSYFNEKILDNSEKQTTTQSATQTQDDSDNNDNSFVDADNDGIPDDSTDYNYDSTDSYETYDYGVDTNDNTVYDTGLESVDSSYSEW
ncbi:MAG: FtsQ-type POTRA domain-containing protein [Ruminococcus sp.]|nr:FtsQ-type POTRA domain-containing protein [Ruminococcus sp.]